MLFVFSLWENTHRTIWLDGSPKDDDKTRIVWDEIFRIASLIEKGDNPLVFTDRDYPHDYFIIKKINMNDIGNKKEADSIDSFCL